MQNLRPQYLNATGFAEVGTVWPRAAVNANQSWQGEYSDFWPVQDFNVGEGGQTQVLWVEYRPAGMVVQALEAHWHTQQALVPLGMGEVIQVVCPSLPHSVRQPDLQRLQAWRVSCGQGVCMNPGTWHATFALQGAVQCLMLTRQSTTIDLVAHLRGHHPAVESSRIQIPSAVIELNVNSE